MTGSKVGFLLPSFVGSLSCQEFPSYLSSFRVVEGKHVDSLILIRWERFICFVVFSLPPFFDII
jgi:hypothetical protein